MCDIKIKKCQTMKKDCIKCLGISSVTFALVSIAALFFYIHTENKIFVVCVWLAASITIAVLTIICIIRLRKDWRELITKIEIILKEESE